MQDDLKKLALKIECAQITARRNMPEVTGVGIRSTDLTFLPIKDRLTTIPTREMYTCKFCIAATFGDYRSYMEHRSTHVTIILQRSKSKETKSIQMFLDNLNNGKY
jgi:hypothetical protein